MRVLLVHANPKSYTVLKGYLQDSGFDVTATDAVEALDTDVYGAIVIDTLDREKVWDHAMTARLRRSNPTVPIIVVDNGTAWTRQVAYIKSGVTHYLSKPRREVVIAYVRQALASKVAETA